MGKAMRKTTYWQQLFQLNSCLEVVGMEPSGGATQSTYRDQQYAINHHDHSDLCLTWIHSDLTSDRRGDYSYRLVYKAKGSDVKIGFGSLSKYETATQSY